MQFFRQHIFRLIAALALMLAGALPVSAAVTGIEMVLCTPDGTKTVIMPGSEVPATQHECADSCCTADLANIAEIFQVTRAGALAVEDEKPRYQPTAALFSHAIPARGPPISV